MTSLTTLFVVVILFFFGGDAINDFAFALIIGVVVGTYSSIFIASAAVLALQTFSKKPIGDNSGKKKKVKKEVATA